MVASSRAANNQRRLGRTCTLVDGRVSPNVVMYYNLLVVEGAVIGVSFFVHDVRLFLYFL